MTDKVLFLRGIGTPSIAEMKTKLLKGAIQQDRTMIEVKYAARGGTAAAITDGAAKFNTAALANSGIKIALGYELGAAALTYWLANYGPTSGISANDLSFVLVENPARKYGGILNSPAITKPYRDAVGHVWSAPGVVTPANTPYTVLDVAQEYDGLCDYPDILGTQFSKMAVTNAVKGFAQARKVKAYNDLNTADMDNFGYVEGHVTYLCAPTVPLPSLRNQWGRRVSAEEADKKLRAQVDSCYSWGQRTSVLYTPTTTDPYAAFGTVDCAESSHFYVRNGELTPQPWMQHRLVESVTSPDKAVSYQVSDGGDKSDTVGRCVLNWINMSPLPQLVHGEITRGGMQVVLQARSRGYLRVASGIGIGGDLPELAECSRFGVGADMGAGGFLVTSTDFCDADVRQASGSFALAPEHTGWLRVEPGQEVTAQVEVAFISEFWEDGSIVGGDIECESGFRCGETRLDLYALPVIDPAASVLYEGSN